MDKSIQPLSLIHTVDHILSFTDLKTSKAARLVCRNWNNSFLNNFHKKFAIRISPGSLPLLSSFDDRILTSIALRPDPLSEATQMLEATFEHLRSSNILGRLKALKLVPLDEKALDFFVKLVNQGKLKMLVKLRLGLKFHRIGSHSGNLVNPGVLPALRIFQEYTTGYESFRDTQLPSVIRSFVDAAPNLEVLATKVALNLPARALRKLTLWHRNETLNDEEAINMINTSARTLTSLRVCDSFSSPLPYLPNISNIILPNWKLQPINLEALPSLQTIEIHFMSIPWEYLPRLLPPAGQLKEMKVVFPCYPYGCLEQEIPMKLLLDSGLKRLTFSFDGWGATLAGFCSTVRNLELLSNAEVLKYSKVLVCEKVRDSSRESWGRHEPEDHIRDFSFLLHKLGTKWDIVRFGSYLFKPAPAWDVMEVPLFGGKKQGKISISDKSDYGFATVVLEVAK